MENIVRLDSETVLTLAEVLTRNDGRTVRICTGSDERGKWIKWDAGYGWTPPFYGLDY